MHISARKHRVLSGIIELLSADYADSRDLRRTIGESLLDLLDADLYASYVWNPQRQAFERGVAINMDHSYVDKYQNYFQHCHASTTRRWMRQGVSLVSAIIPHRELERTEIYNDFLRPSGHYYGINLFAFDGRDSIGDIRIWRRNGHPDFDRDEVGLLSLITPGFTQALKRIETRSGQRTPTRPASARLSPREAEVAELAAQGLADKEIARRLDVTFATVRTHLDNAFSKFGVRNRTQLVSLLRGSDRFGTRQ
ncbi:LuxR C-terminal-related transcriptional regulator [Bradyrhizobium sp. RDI18]|uniref:helix-turn-helix transcriptional regulator n=1 Tax=Bradyrhizobium sp. RDI18 TaxID=3367400 RepID=UPI0037112B65